MIKLLCSIVVSVLMFGCDGNYTPPETPAAAFFQGTHKLMAINKANKSDDNGRSFGNFNNFDKQDNSRYVVSIGEVTTFYWQNNKNQFVQATLPSTKVRFELNDKLSTIDPVCKFRWSPNQSFSESEWIKDVVYVVIVAKESQISKE